STIANNGTTGTFSGILIQPSAGAQTTVMIERSVIDNNRYGIFLDGAGGAIRGLVKNSVVSGNANNGISVNTNGANVGIVVDNTAGSGTSVGLVAAGAGGAILVRHATITANGTGLLAASGGNLFSYGDNVVNNNSTDGSFTGTISTH